MHCYCHLLKILESISTNMNTDMNKTEMNITHFDIRSTMNCTTTDLNLANGTCSPQSMLHTYSNGVRYTYATLLIMILVVTMVANITLIALICYHRKLHTTTNIFIANLAFGDTIMAIAVLPFDIDYFLRGYFAFNTRVCEISSTIFFLSLPASALNLSILTLERFCAIRFPLMHRTGRIFTSKRKLIILLSSWFYTSITACLPVMGWRNYSTSVANGECQFDFKIGYALFQLCVNFISPLVFIIILNIWILRIARKGLPSRLLSRKSSSGTQRILRKSSGTSASYRQKQVGRKLSKQVSANSPEANKKAAKIIATLVGVFACCWLPYIVNVTINISCKGCSPREITSATMILVFLNSAINPILYGIYKPQIRSSLKEVSAKIANKVCRSGEKRRSEAHQLDKEIELTCV